jgi:uncharacterized protein YfkK (UPF0435 family)
MEGIQTILIIVVVSLTLLLVVVGIQVVLMILDVRKTLNRLNTILEDSVMGGGLITPEKLTSIFTFFKKKKNLKSMFEDSIETLSRK